MKKLRTVFLTAVFLSIWNPLFSQDIIEVINTPTANSVDFGGYSLSFRVYGQGSILARLFYGIIMENLTLGISFNIENVVGTGNITPRRPYLYIKLPLYSGSFTWPALSIGFDEQGFGNYNNETGTYQFDPMGFFLVFTKMNFAPNLNISAGINTNYLIIQDGREKIMGFINAYFAVGPNFMTLAEVKSLGAGREVYGNAGFKFLLSPELHFEVAALNIGNVGEIERILRITYKGLF